MADILLELKNISMHFGGLKAVDDVSFVIHKGEILSLIGPNGAGKTTAFNVITGVYTPTLGEVIFKGININVLKPYQITKLGIARTFQNIRLFGQLSAIDNIIIAMHCRRTTNMFQSIFRTFKYNAEEKKCIEEADALLDYMGLLGDRNEQAQNLPYGKQRKLEIARALATGADLLLLDEPAAGMNPQETEELMETIQNIRKDLEKTVFLIEHDMKLVMGISDRIVVFDYGKLIAEGKPEEIRTNPRVIEAYLGKEVENNA
ncbi:ABC transporter ATP-binding protein [Calditerrivibrio nitroreducens]|uniref:Amino acid/amide ABC transporter ATP-binding protein 1, HAAT family n=1 Tax=Calditerrivibrio nitroreducens (strain DSM 19672 / NBRC 101217 / Yu37-1) TaxID=768670 RepID=E4TGC5_CALNY|nr:ABC transporter ATP-binding protein [Calditerrivibrio nitroreducens]ADR18606.1 amino acid/amide ABC transporter ATP-binding protein 1, HAAT family [Calditerrivibrio nitroreducens DSM 19672]